MKRPAVPRHEICRAQFGWASAALVIVTAAISSFAQAADDPHELDLKTERVIIFKDGYSLVIKQGTATSDKNGEVFTFDVPDAAVLGSFWAIPEEGRLVSMTAGWKNTKDTESKDSPCTQPIEILLANQGKSAKIELHDKTLYAGVIQSVLVEKVETPLAENALPAFEFGALSAKFANAKAGAKARSFVKVDPTVTRTLTTIGGSNFVLRTEEGDVLLPVTSVRSILVKDMATTVAKQLTVSRRTKQLSFKFEKGDQKQSIRLMYFRPGMRWIPTYRVQLNDKPQKKLATIDLQAELLNEAEDLDNVPIDIVVGVPNFRFRDTPSPLVLEATLRNALAEAAPQLMGNGGQAMSNAMYSQRAGEFRRNQAAANQIADNGNVELPGELTASGSQDLFVYSLPKISLAKGERAAVPIFSTEVPYKDIYTWDVHITRQDVEAAPSGSGLKSPLVLSKNEVWHQIVLTNNTKLPWTTGAAMIMQGNQPLAQELLTYTPPKDEVRVPVTVSVDTRGSLTEKETDRELKALDWQGHNYARIQKEIKLDLCNNKPIAIDTEITLRVGGKVADASDEGDITLSPFDAADWIQYQGNPAVNNSSQVTWKVTLKPGDNFEPTVKYQYFTRH